MSTQPKKVVTDAPWSELTYQIIGLAMALHNEIGPGHRENVYHNGMVIKLHHPVPLLLVSQSPPQLNDLIDILPHGQAQAGRRQPGCRAIHSA